MNKGFIFILALAAGLVGIAIGIAAGRSHLSTVRRIPDARAHLEPARVVTSVKNTSTSQSDRMSVIRFASNPQPAPRFLFATLTEALFPQRNGMAKLYS